ncbi:Nuclear pore complex protein Nup98-Nup96 [Xylographa bjoerkii]|nr:Nuclear pore complex protein Nup98-Nup96 [Xylographa bjoerkii]
MASFGGFGGFGSNNNNNNQQQSTGFGGFGSNTGTGFGQQPQNTGFGASSNTTGGNLFGSGGTGFGTGTTAFGTSSKPPFGSTSTSTLFGSTAATTGGSAFGGFGANTSNTTNNAFGGGATTGGFNKPAFGTGTSTAGGIFGGAPSSGSGFGQGTSQPASSFGAPQSTALGSNVTDCAGTGATPFSPFTEKDGLNGPLTNHFQTITFMPPYQKFSLEELRLADYNQGRRYGNSNGQAGAFGTNSGFGGFGQSQSQNNNTLFGNNASTGFGSTKPTATPSAFGTSAGTGGMFGSQNNSSGLGLFGSTPATSSQQTGGLFANAGGGTGFGGQSSTGGFGATNTGLFGNNAQTTKAPFSFGTTSTTGTGFGGGGFGTNSAATGGGGLFSNPTSSAFGAQPAAPASNAFGGGTQQSVFGGFGTDNTQKPGGLFGNSTGTTGSNLFGATNQANTSANAFGTNNNQASSNSLFAPKPQVSGTNSLFGASNNTTNPTGSTLFGSGFGNNNNQAQQNAPSLFGGNTQQQQKPSLFGTTTGGNNANMFGGGNNSGSLFTNLGTSSNQNQAGQSLFSNGSNSNGNSIFGGAQQNVLQAPESMSASLFDRNPYGSASIFNGLPPPPAHVTPGPIATPISAGQYKPKKYAPLPQYMVNPPLTSRLVTPQKRGYGFSYSTYGTPSSASSLASTPGALGSSLLGSSIGRGLGKSFSTSNLRRTFDSDAESVLSPGAFSANSVRYSGTGSLKKLTIDRSLRTDLFGSQAVAALPSPDRSDQSRQPSILKKKVSFDSGTLGGSNGNEAGSNGAANGSSNGAETNSSSNPQEQGYSRSSSRSNGRQNGSRSAATPAQPETEPVKGNELAIVPEDGSPEVSSTSNGGPPAPSDQSDPKPGAYYMRPSREDLRRMSRDKLKKVSGFTVGRENCGEVVFNEPVDLTTIDLDNVFDRIAIIKIRSVTVYPDQHQKPLPGKGLNVPATISLKNSWPKQRDKVTPSYEKSGPKFNKHVARLKKVADTEFVDYDKDTGVWTFRVPHFTTYELEYGDEDTSEVDPFQSSVLSEAPSTPTPKSRYTPRQSQPAQESSMLSEEPSEVSSAPDDTFDFRNTRMLPGAFDGRPAFDNDQEMEEVQENTQSFLDGALARSPSDSGADEPSDLQEEHDHFKDRSVVVQDDDMEMAGAFPQTNEDHEYTEGITQPKSILKASQMSLGTPTRLIVNMGDDWAEQLQKTISPKKQDRHALRQTQLQLFKEDEDEQGETPVAQAPIRDANGFATSIDLMNSLFGKEQQRKSGRDVKQTGNGKAFEWPYPKKSKRSDQQEMTDMDRNFHESYKPSWGPQSRLLYALSGKSGGIQQIPSNSKSLVKKKNATIVSEGRDIRIADFTVSSDMSPEKFADHRSRSEIVIDQGIPYAKAIPLPFRVMASTCSDSRERLVWDLASILFDDYDTDDTFGVPENEISTYEHRIRKDRMSTFWSQICQDKALAAVSAAPTAEERAIAYLSTHKVAEACDALVEGKDFRLATLVAQIGGDSTMHEDMTTQIDAWRSLKHLSEMTDPVRALYELLAGNTCVCQGNKGQSEDMAQTFVITERFKLDWKRSFGLRLWYAIKEEDAVEVAVKKYAADLGTKETRTPVPWFIEEGLSLPWTDPQPEIREDLLWGLLKLYAESKDGIALTKLTEVVMPQNASGNPIDTRLSFEMYHALSTRLPDHVDFAKADQLAWDFAVELEAAGEWKWAIFAVLHVSDAKQRQKALLDTLARHAANISEVDAETIQLLTVVFKIPEAWVWTAKALYARTVQENHVKEVDYLLRAKCWNEAHKTLCRVVAPQAVIEQSHGTLLQLLENFAGKDKVSEWPVGGQVYEDYLRLIRGLKGRERHAVIQRLLHALPNLVQDRPGKLGFIEMVAVQEMSAVVGRAVVADQDKTLDGARILQLPLTGDEHLKHTMGLSLDYYKALMAHG